MQAYGIAYGMVWHAAYRKALVCTSSLVLYIYIMSQKRMSRTFKLIIVKKSTSFEIQGWVILSGPRYLIHITGSIKVYPERKKRATMDRTKAPSRLTWYLVAVLQRFAVQQYVPARLPMPLCTQVSPGKTHFFVKTLTPMLTPDFWQATHPDWV